VFAGSLASSRAQEPERLPPPEGRIRPEARLVPQRQWEYKQLPRVPARDVQAAGAEL